MFCHTSAWQSIQNKFCDFFIYSGNSNYKSSIGGDKDMFFNTNSRLAEDVTRHLNEC